MQVKLNIGSFICMFQNDWINIDILNLYEYAKQKNFLFRQLDCSKALPFDDNIVDLIYTSHFLEHLTYQEGLKFLTECYRIMRSDGIIRIFVPDANWLINRYLNNTMGELDKWGENCANSKYQIQKLWSIMLEHHHSMYDASMLTGVLKEVGFKVVEQMKLGHSLSQRMLAETVDMFPDISLIVEAVK